MQFLAALPTDPAMQQPSGETIIRGENVELRNLYFVPNESPPSPRTLETLAQTLVDDQEVAWLRTPSQMLQPGWESRSGQYTLEVAPTVANPATAVGNPNLAVAPGMGYLSNVPVPNLPLPPNDYPFATQNKLRMVTEKRKKKNTKQNEEKRRKVEREYCGEDKDGLVQQFGYEGTTFGWRGGMRGRINLEGTGLVHSAMEALKHSQPSYIVDNLACNNGKIVDVVIDITWNLIEDDNETLEFLSVEEESLKPFRELDRKTRLEEQASREERRAEHEQEIKALKQKGKTAEALAKASASFESPQTLPAPPTIRFTKVFPIDPALLTRWGTTPADLARVVVGDFNLPKRFAGIIAGEIVRQCSRKRKRNLQSQENEGNNEDDKEVSTKEQVKETDNFHVSFEGDVKSLKSKTIEKILNLVAN